MSMSKLEAYLTADMRDKVRHLNKKGIIHHFKEVSAKESPCTIERGYCPQDNRYCTMTCHECWESFVNKVKEGGNPVL